MHHTLFSSCITRVHPRQPIFLVFPERTSTTSVRALLTLLQGGRLSLQDAWRITDLQMVAQHGNWTTGDRKVAVNGLQSVSTHPSLVTLSQGLETLWTGEHFGQKIFTTNVAARQAAVTSIIEGAVGVEVAYEARKWDLTVTGEFYEVDGLPAMKFSIRDGSKAVVRVYLDGLTGRVRIMDQPWSDDRCLDADSLRTKILAALDAYLDTLTAGTPA